MSKGQAKSDQIRPNPFVTKQGAARPRRPGQAHFQPHCDCDCEIETVTAHRVSQSSHRAMKLAAANVSETRTRTVKDSTRTAQITIALQLDVGDS